MKSWKYKFLEKTLLGRKTNINNPHEVIKKCIKLAYKDMLDAGRYYLKKDCEKICDDFLDVLYRNNFQFSKNMILQAKQLFGENEVIGENKRYVTRFGLSQKLVNMTFKYLYVFCDYTNLKIDFSQCDCPLDSAILNEINYKDNVWSKLTEEQYDMCQSKISENLKGLTLDNELKQIANLAFDFIKW